MWSSAGEEEAAGGGEDGSDDEGLMSKESMEGATPEEVKRECARLLYKQHQLREKTREIEHLEALAALGCEDEGSYTRWEEPE